MTEVDGISILHFATVIAFAFLVWDMIITIADEVELVWGARFSASKFLYFFIRYSGLAFQTFDLVINIIIPGQINGLVVSIIQAIGMAATIKAVEIALIMRVVALYNRNRLITASLVVLFICAVGATGALGVLHIRSARSPSGDRSQISAMFWVPTMVFESLLFSLTLFAFPKAVRKRGDWAPSQIVSTFVRDGVWAFAVLFAALLINQRIYSTEVHGEKRTLGIFVTSFVFCGYRLLLNVRRMARCNEEAVKGQTITSMQFEPAPRPRRQTDEEMAYDMRLGVPLNRSLSIDTLPPGRSSTSSEVESRVTHPKTSTHHLSTSRL